MWGKAWQLNRTSGDLKRRLGNKNTESVGEHFIEFSTPFVKGLAQCSAAMDFLGMLVLLK